MDDRITLNDVPVPTRIGISDAERATEQTLLVTVTLSVDTSKAGASDDIADTIDYDAVALLLRDLGTTERKTLEKFAEDAAEALLTTFTPAKVKVAVTKPNVCECKSATVTIVRPQKSDCPINVFAPMEE